VGGGEARTLGCVPIFLIIGTPYYNLEPTLSASQNPRTHFGVRRGAPGLCRAHVKGRTPTRTRPPRQQQTTSVAVALLMCSGVTGSTRVSPETSAGGIKIRRRSFRWLPARDHGEATGHRARGTSLVTFRYYINKYQPFHRRQYRQKSILSVSLIVITSNSFTGGVE
jgi:hypothetical protein